jgi:hypothetical protein
LLLHLLAGVALAAAVPIDHFNDGTLLSVTDATGGGNFDFAAGGSAFGGERDVLVTRSGANGTASVVIDPATHYLQFLTSSNSTGGTAILQLDGADGAATLAALASPISLDPTSAGGTNLGFHIEVVGANNPVLLTIEVYSNGNANCSTGSRGIPTGIPTTSNVDFFLLFSALSPCPSMSAADLTAVTAVQIILTAPANTEFRLDFLEASAKRDFGDLPASYGEVSHSASIGTRLGANLDTEASQFFSVDALGDDLSEARDDEDGVVVHPGEVWNDAGSGSVDATVNFCPATCTLAGWVDWNKDGDFADAGERALLNTAISNGSSNQPITVPSGVVVNGTYAARFRLFNGTVANPQPTGDGAGGGAGTFAVGGEVEDYYFAFGPTAIQLKALDARSGVAQMALPLAIGLVLCLLALAMVFYLRRRQA